MSTILITGSNGFFGKNLVKVWQHSHRLIGVDDNSNAIVNKELHERFDIDYYYQNLLETPFVPGIEDTDIVVHLAAKTRITPSWESFGNYYTTNIVASQNLLKCAQEHGVKKFVYFSSSSVYGNSTKQMSEADRLHPTNPYAVSKMAAEAALLAQAQQGNTELIIVRPFTMYGDYMNYGKGSLAISKFIAAIEQDQPLTIEGDGLQERDFIHASDAIKALELVIEHGRSNEIYNIGTGKYVTIKSIADHLSPDQINVQRRTGEVQRTWADISKIKEFGFMPEVDLYEWLNVYLEKLSIKRK